MVVDGHLINWREWGDAAATPVLLLHASGCHSGWWEWAAPLLSHRFRLIAPDLRGHGDSGWATHYGWGDYAGDLVALIETLGLTTVGVVGHSMGGYIGLELANARPDLVAALVVADMKTDASEEELAQLARAAAKPGRGWATREEAVAAYRLMPPEHCVPPERLQRMAQESVRMQSDGNWGHKMDRRSLAYEPLAAETLAAGLACPVLFVRGEHSSIMPAARALALTDVAGGRFAELPGTYHHLMLEDPDGFCARIAPFLAEHLSS